MRTARSDSRNRCGSRALRRRSPISTATAGPMSSSTTRARAPGRSGSPKRRRWSSCSAPGVSQLDGPCIVRCSTVKPRRPVPLQRQREGQDTSAGKWAQAITQSSLDFVVKPGKTAWAGAKVVIPADFSGDKLSDVFLMTASGKWTVATFTSRAQVQRGTVGGWLVGHGERTSTPTYLADLLLYNPKNGRYRVVVPQGNDFHHPQGCLEPKLQVGAPISTAMGLSDAVVYDAGVGLVGHCHCGAKAGVFVYPWRHISKSARSLLADHPKRP